ncbi:MAG: hypothetical protein ACTSRZ_18075 [Promethearchaeota archaeon]
MKVPKKKNVATVTIDKFKDKYSLKDIITGNISKDFFLKKLYPISIAIIFLSILIAYILIPPYESRGKYSWWIDTISGLGDFIENPYGWWGFSVAIFTNAILLLSFIFYIYKRLSKICLSISRLASFFIFIGVLGMFIITIVTDTPNGDWIYNHSMSFYHTKIAFVTFASLAAGIGLYWFVFIKDSSPKLGGRKEMDYWHKIIIPYLYFFIIGLLVGVTQLIRALNNWGWINDGNGILEVVTRFQFWEWMMFFMMFTYIYLIIKFVPEKISKY